MPNSIPFAQVIPFRPQGDNVDAVVEELRKILPEGPKYFPDDMITDQPERLLVAEIVREKLFRCTRRSAARHRRLYGRNEGPGQPQGLHPSQSTSNGIRKKRIVIGKNGAVLKEIGNLARQEIENLLGSSVYLDIWVKVKRTGATRRQPSANSAIKRVGPTRWKHNSSSNVF